MNRFFKLSTGDVVSGGEEVTKLKEAVTQGLYPNFHIISQSSGYRVWEMNSTGYWEPTTLQEFLKEDAESMCQPWQKVSINLNRVTGEEIG